MSQKPKVISIIDCFVHDETVKTNLKRCINDLKNTGHDILLISNTKIDTEIVEMVDYHFYDSRNQLFQKDYPGVTETDFWTDNENFKVHNIKAGVQKHGLSVLINLFNGLRIAKELGYTHFHRFETDDFFGPISLAWIKAVPLIVQTNSMKGLFYVNPNNFPPDASFHYYFCEIDYFIDNFQTIKSEQDYEDFLMESQGNRNFRIVEEYLYHYIEKIKSENLLILRDGKENMIKEDFPDTVWNTVSSSSNFSDQLKNCITGIYKVYQNGQRQEFFYLYSSNYSDSLKIRRIKVKCFDGSEFEIAHNLAGKNHWCLDKIPENTSDITVYEEGSGFTFSEKIEDVKSYIELK